LDNKIVNYNNFNSLLRRKSQTAKSNNNQGYYANNARLLCSLAKLDSIEFSKKSKS